MAIETWDDVRNLEKEWRWSLLLYSPLPPLGWWLFWEDVPTRWGLMLILILLTVAVASLFVCWLYLRWRLRQHDLEQLQSDRDRLQRAAQTTGEELNREIEAKEKAESELWRLRLENQRLRWQLERLQPPQPATALDYESDRDGY